MTSAVAAHHGTKERSHGRRRASRAASCRNDKIGLCGQEPAIAARSLQTPTDFFFDFAPASRLPFDERSADSHKHSRCRARCAAVAPTRALAVPPPPAPAPAVERSGRRLSPRTGWTPRRSSSCGSADRRSAKAHFWRRPGSVCSISCARIAQIAPGTLMMHRRHGGLWDRPR